jgi:prepilin-type processing-associated H-X9-DG protein
MAPGHCSYIYLAAGLSTSEKADLPVMADRPGNHGVGGNVLFLDGTVRFFDSRGLVSLLETGEERIKRERLNAKGKN